MRRGWVPTPIRLNRTICLAGSSVSSTVALSMGCFACINTNVQFQSPAKYELQFKRIQEKHASLKLLVYHVNQCEDSMDTPFVCLYQPKHQRNFYSCISTIIKNTLQESAPVFVGYCRYMIYNINIYIYAMVGVTTSTPDPSYDFLTNHPRYFWFFKLFPSTIKIHLLCYEHFCSHPRLSLCTRLLYRK